MNEPLINLGNFRRGALSSPEYGESPAPRAEDIVFNLLWCPALLKSSKYEFTSVETVVDRCVRPFDSPHHDYYQFNAVDNQTHQSMNSESFPQTMHLCGG